MSLESLPPQLENTDHEHCFESCLGMTLAHYGKLGTLGLADIVGAVTRPDEEFTPYSRELQWLQTFGTQVEYIEPYTEESAGIIESLTNVGITCTQVAPTMELVFEHVARGYALMSQINYEEDTGQPDYNLNHVVFVAEHQPDESVLIIDPDGYTFGMEDLSGLWGRYPNLISVRLAE